MSKQSSAKGPGPVPKFNKPIFDEIEQGDSKDEIGNEEDDNEDLSDSE